MPNIKDLHSPLLRVAVEAAVRAGDAIMEIYDRPQSDWQIEQKADHSPLTLADRTAHALIVEQLQPTGIPVVSEEGAQRDDPDRSSWEKLWVVDPLDGTKEFIKRNGEFTVNIALVLDSKPVMGVVYVPVSRKLYYGLQPLPALQPSEAEAGAWRAVAGRDEELSSVEKLPAEAEGHSGFVVVASRSHLSPETEDYISRLRQQHSDVQLRSAGSSLKLCLIAEGSADVYPRFAPTMEWDTAAGDAVVRAAGGETVYAEDETHPLHYNKADLHNPWFISRPSSRK